MDFEDKIPEEYATFVVIPTILNSKEKVKEYLRKLEVYYLANKLDNIYFALLGDCTSGKNKEEKYDIEIEEEAIKEVERLNEKYGIDKEKCPKFSFIYRKRFWNGKEECYLGWERKRGLLNQFNEYILGKSENEFKVNTLENWKNKEKNLPKIKYVITLDSDTNLTLNSAGKLIGAMAHILNKPILNDKKDIVISGHAIIQPRIGINLDDARKNLFTKIYAGSGGTDPYVNAISDIYEDIFDEGIFTGKGIYDLEVFYNVLKDEIPENKVLSHDLLEGSYLRAGLATDILLLDGYPTNYNSYKQREYRWLRGDFQIISWLKKYIVNRNENKKKNPLNKLSKYKIFDNLARGLFPVASIFSIIYLNILGKIYNIDFNLFLTLIILSNIMPTIIDIVDKIICYKNGKKTKKYFEKDISENLSSIIRGFINILLLPDKAYTNLKAIVKTLYRLLISKKHMLEWVTSEETEKLSKTDLKSYYKNMISNVILGIVEIILYKNIINYILGILFIIAPLLMWYISKKEKKEEIINKLNSDDKEYIFKIGKDTFKYFKDMLNEENNYLPPDNYQEDRKEKIAKRTSPTNIGLAILVVISSYDLGYEKLEDTLLLLEKMINTIEKLPKWNGHLYNWYDIKTLEPLIPRYISAVDSGNFIGYIYVLKQFYLEIKSKIESKQLDEKLIKYIPDWVDKSLNEIPFAKANFSKLYDYEKQLFTIGFNVEENKLTDSYYDLLASEARLTSLVAIAKKDIPSKHWANLSRTLTSLNGYKGLISWSGTAFEYLMPNIIVRKYKGSLIDESCKFMIMSQKEYAEKLGVPWGFSETAFNIKDLNGNYQYKAIGIPWLGLKRGLEDDITIATYGSAMAIIDDPKGVIKNLKRFENENMYGKYGFYESIDYTPERLNKGKKYEAIKTYMAHHEALILISINNLLLNNIMQERFMKNEEIEAVDILLQERMPGNIIITKEEKVKPSKIKYMDYENYAKRIYTKKEFLLDETNVISSNDYTIIINQKGEGYSKYKDIYINRFKVTSDSKDGIFFFMKNIKTKRIYPIGSINYLSNPDKYMVRFSEDVSEFTRIDGNIQTKLKITIDALDPIEIRSINIKNLGLENERLEVTSFLEPILSNTKQDYMHPAFNNLFLSFEYIKDKNIIIVKRRKRGINENEIYMAIAFFTQNNKSIGELEYEINKEKFLGRGNINLPIMIKDSKPFSNKIDLVIDPIIALKRTFDLNKDEEINLNYILAIGKTKDEAIEQIKKYESDEAIENAYEVSRAKTDAQSRYLRLNSKKIETYQEMIKYLIFPNLPQLNLKKIDINKKYPKEDLWKYGISGDLPILLFEMKNVNDEYILEDILKSYEYFRIKNIEIDLVILNEEPNNYENSLKQIINNQILSKGLLYMQNIKGGIFVLESDSINKDLIEFWANLKIEGSNGPISRILKDLEEDYIEKQEKIGNIPEKIYVINEENIKKENLNVEELEYYNEFGGFDKDKKEYLIKVNTNDRLPTVWSNILANKNFGTLVTEDGTSYTWSKNSRLNRISAWPNDQVKDIPSEIIYIEDKESLKTCSLTLNPMPDNNDYIVTYGLGYTMYNHTCFGINQNLCVFVPNSNEKLKINILDLKNLEAKKKNIRLFYYIKPVLGEDEKETNGHIKVEYDNNLNTIYAKNLSNKNFDEILYLSSSENIKSYTKNRNFFIGNGNLSNPEGIKKISLDSKDGICINSLIVYELEIELEAFETRKISFIIGQEENKIDCQDKIYKYSKIENCLNKLEETKKYWNEITGRMQVKTPVKSFDIMLNSCLFYQVMASRMLGRTGFYQSGGAFGFRDQLQDTIGLKYIDENILKEQIIKHSMHQFIEGDVEHWWHDETKRGIRTKFSDDLLWLPYIVYEYIEFTEDYSILDIETSYKIGKVLKENEDEKYDLYEDGDVKESIFMHCIRAINKSLDFGENGLPKIGSGDWNDGMNTVGNKGKGESVWLGFFLYEVLRRFIEILKYKNSLEKDKYLSDINYYKNQMDNLKKALNTAGWDGRWYRRAFADDGKILGTIQNEECRIDGISQSWAVISNAGDNDKKYICMEALENHLIDKENGIIKLLDPPFEKSSLEPGYIKAYLPGTRENGGQYTHGAIWAIIAEAKLGFGDKAVEMFRMINPIEHSKTKEQALKYKVEPYVVAADIYGYENLTGRGGWTWYTGSASWMIEAGLSYILGFKIRNGYIEMNPCIASNWKEYSIQYKYKNTIYNIKVYNKNGKNTGVERVKVNGEIQKNKKILLNDDGKIYDIEVYM